MLSIQYYVKSIKSSNLNYTNSQIIAISFLRHRKTILKKKKTKSKLCRIRSELGNGSEYKYGPERCRKQKYLETKLGLNKKRNKGITASVADPHHFDADPDPDPAFHFDADPDPAFSQDVKKSNFF